MPDYDRPDRSTEEAKPVYIYDIRVDASWDYDAACHEAMVAQGLGPALDALRNAGVSCEVEQTGGFVMVLTVPADDGTFAITADDDDLDRFLVCWYPGTTWHTRCEEADLWPMQTLNDVLARITIALAIQKLAHAIADGWADSAMYPDLTVAELTDALRNEDDSWWERLTTATGTMTVAITDRGEVINRAVSILQA